MEKIIFLKYGELSTKKDNINFFIKTLKDNIKKKIDNIDISYDYGRMFLKPINDNFDDVCNQLKEVCGIHEIIIAYKLKDKNIELIKDNLLKLIQDKEFKTFKIVAKRSDKKYLYNSMELRNILGSLILKNKNNIKVDVHNPEIVINIEIRLKEVLIYFDSIKGLHGYPVGCLSKGLLMLSGGIDSPVAGYLTIKRGVRLEGIYFESPPHTSNEALEKVKKLSQILAKYNNDFKLHIINITSIQEEIYKNIPHDYLITILRRMMYRISALIAFKINAKIIVNGESIGQVASQTLSSINCINRVVNIPVIRPLACFDKLEIIDLAKKINTFDISILPYEDCCTIFVPEHPVINPTLKLCEEYEKLIDYQNLIYECIKNHKVLIIKEEDLKHSDLL